MSNYYTKPETVSLLNNYATKAEIPDTTGLASQTWVEEKGYLTTHQPLKTINGESIVGTGNITISGGSPDMSNYYTKEQIDAKGYLTEHQSLANYALKSEIPDVSGYLTLDTLPKYTGGVE